ncbi:hypothetical protein TNCV_1820071 [Trichonephila clavipes]|nr:hypothetical protein TNCV_1820071 [Trichonephila clavipes]
MCVSLEALWVCSSFSWTTMHHVIAQIGAEQLLESEDIERMIAGTIFDLNPIEHVWIFRQTLGSSYLPPVTIRESGTGAARRMGIKASTNIDTPHSQHGQDAVKPAIKLLFIPLIFSL